MGTKSRSTLPPPNAPLSNRLVLVYLGLLTAAILICFFPLLLYFFSQDDFTLLNNAARTGAGGFWTYFSHGPGQFRPLTKILYFSAMYETFGLNAAVYHAVSIAVHILNSILIFLLLIRCRVSAAAALVVTTLFGLSVAFFHVIAWIACIQQILGQCFALTALILGIDFLRHGSSRAKWGSIAAYLLALLSVEQTYMVPVILLVFVKFNIGGWVNPPALRETLDKLFWHLGIMLAYTLFMALYRGIPQAGPYEFVFGQNVLINLITYLGWTVQFGAVLPVMMNKGTTEITFAHIVIVALLVYHFFMRRFQVVTFGLLYFILAVLPALFLLKHTFYLHTYLAVFGVLYVIAAAVDDLMSVPALRARTARYAVLFGVLAGISIMSYVMVRKNVEYKMYSRGIITRSFVLRRAEVAKNIYDSINESRDTGKDTQKVFMVYAREGGAEAARWNHNNVKMAIGTGSLIRLIYGKPDLPVEFADFNDSFDTAELDEVDVYFFDDLGNCRKMELVPHADD